MKYNKEETLKHYIASKFVDCIEDFNQIIFRDDDSLSDCPNYFTNVLVINLDCVEIKMAKFERRLQRKTMDTAFAISNSTNLEMLLVELRFNYVNLSNLDRNNLLGKVTGSIDLLGGSILLNEKFIFVFQSNLVEQAKNRLQRMNPRIPNNYIAMDLTELISIYF